MILIELVRMYFSYFKIFCYRTLYTDKSHYLHNAKDSQNLRFLAFKNNIIIIKALEERIREERKFLKKWKIINTALSS